MQPRRNTTAARALRALAAVSIAVCAAVIMTWPLASAPGSLGRTPHSGDARYAAWNVAWVAHAVATEFSNLYDANIFHPHENTLAYSEGNIGAGVLTVPVWLLTHNVQATYNAALLFSFAASLVAMWLLARRLTGDPWAAAVAAPLFAFCPYLFSHLTHIQLLMCAGLPVIMLALHALVDAPSVMRGVALGCALAGQALFCAYYGIFGGLMVGYAALFYAASRRLWRVPRYWTALGFAAVLSVLIVLPFFLPYLRVQEEFQFRRTLDDSRMYSAILRSYLASSAHAHRWMLLLIREWNHEVLFPGFMALAFAAAGLVVTLRPSRTNSVPIPQGRETALLYASLGALAFWTSLGPRFGLYTLLYHVIPVFSFLRAPGRTGIVVMLTLAVLAGFGVQRLLAARSERWRRAAAATLCGVALIELNLLPVPWRHAEPVPAAYRVLARMPRGAVAEFPFYDQRVDFHLHTAYMLRSTEHWHPLVNGYSDNIPADFRTLAKELATFPSRESFRALRDRRVRYIVVDWSRYGPGPSAEIAARLGAFMEYLRPLARDTQTAVFEVVAFPEH